MPTLSEKLLWLCRIPSPIGEERALCDAVSERVSGLTLAAPIRRYDNSLVVPVTRGRGPAVALVGHLDTVRTEHDGPPRIEGGKLYGAGAADMKSGLAVMLHFAEHGAELPVDLTLVFYAGEEGPFEENELGPVLDQDPELEHVDIACCLEPSDNHLHLGCAGSVHAQVTFQGRTAHSARPWQGENAIHKAGAFLTRLHALTPTPHVIDELTWYNVMSATLAEGGRARNIIPDILALNVNYRFGPDVTLDEAKAEIERLVAAEAEIEFIDMSPPARPFRHHPYVEALIESGVVGVEPKQAWTDVGRFAAHGIPAVNLGPGDNAQAHQPNEWTTLEKLDQGLGIFQTWLEKLGKLGKIADPC